MIAKSKTWIIEHEALEDILDLDPSYYPDALVLKFGQPNDSLFNRLLSRLTKIAKYAIMNEQDQSFTFFFKQATYADFVRIIERDGGKLERVLEEDDCTINI